MPLPASAHPLPAKLAPMLRELRRQLEDLYGDRLRHVVLFGSQARGDATPESDVDVLVVLGEPFDRSAEQRRTTGLFGDLSLEHAIDLSCIHVSEQQFLHGREPFLIFARSEGIEIL